MTETIVSEPSSAWYIVPIFLGILGGIVGYFVVKDENKDMANYLLLIGILSTILVTIESNGLNTI